MLLCIASAGLVVSVVGGLVGVVTGVDWAAQSGPGAWPLGRVLAAIAAGTVAFAGVFALLLYLVVTKPLLLP